MYTRHSPGIRLFAAEQISCMAPTWTLMGAQGFCSELYMDCGKLYEYVTRLNTSARVEVYAHPGLIRSNRGNSFISEEGE